MDERIANRTGDDAPPIAGAPNDPDAKWRSLHEHLYRVKLITYSVLLIVGVTQIILREQFPQIKVPWHWVGGALIVGLIGFVSVSTIIHLKRTQSPGTKDAHRSADGSQN